MVVPHHWVDKDINVLSFPKKDISIHVMKWAKPAPDWKEYEITKLLLELGTKARCDEFEKNYVDSTQTDSEVDSDATVVDTPSSQRVRTPILRSPADMGLRRRIISSPEAEVQSPPRRKKSSSSWNGRVLSMEQTPIPSTDATNVIPASQETTSSLVRPVKGHPPLKTGFKKLKDEDFQYQVLMRLSSLEDAFDGFKTEVMKALGSMSRDVDLAIDLLEPMETMKQFDELEEKLAEDTFFRSMLLNMKKVGVVEGKGKKSVKNLLDNFMMPTLQSLFNRDGGIRIPVTPDRPKKRGMSNTLFYKCFKEALAANGMDYASIHKNISDVLKSRSSYRKSAEQAVQDDAAG